MTTFTTADGITFNLPAEGTVFRATGDQGDAVYKIVNGQLTTIAGKSYVPATDLRMPDGSIAKAGQPYTGSYDITRSGTPVDPNYRGVNATPTTGASNYQSQTGQSFQSLPEFNIGDIQTATQKNGGTFPTTDTTLAPDPSVAGYKNPNAVNPTTGGYQAQPSAAAPTATTQNNNSSSTIAPPNVQLQPGSTDTAAVKQLQDYLVSKGYMTQAQVNTGYGTYGPQTTAAVQKMQEALGVNNASGPGYYGPQTLAAVNSSTTGSSSSNNTNTGGGPTGSGEGSGIAYDPSWAARGITQDMWNQANATERATLATQMAGYKLLADKPISSITTDEAFKAASADPNVIQPFLDAFKLDKTAFTQSLQQLQTATSTTAQQQQTQFENDRRALAEAQAASGTAYSGFRGRAQEQLAQSEQGVVTSSRAQAQKNLQDLTSAFEAKYGSAATTPATLAFLDPMAASTVSVSGQSTPGTNSSSTLSGTLAGGIVGSQANAPGGAQYAAENAAANTAYQQGMYPATAGA